MYLVQDSTPRIVKLGDNPGCPCGGTHVSDISEIMSITVSICLHQHSYEMIFYIKNLYGYVRFLGDLFCYVSGFSNTDQERMYEGLL